MEAAASTMAPSIMSSVDLVEIRLMSLPPRLSDRPFDGETSRHEFSRLQPHFEF
jgi:hypothetical protein